VIQRIDFDLNIIDCLNSWHDFEDNFNIIHDSEPPTLEWHRRSELLYRLRRLRNADTIRTIEIHILWQNPSSIINPNYNFVKARVQKIQDSWVAAFAENVPARFVSSHP
jgi:hypothetical protein